WGTTPWNPRSYPVHLRCGDPREPLITRTTIEEGLGELALFLYFLAQSMRSLNVGGRLIIASGNHDAVVGGRPGAGHLAPGDVLDDAFDLPGEWVSPAASARGADPDQGSRGYRLGIGQSVRKFFSQILGVKERYLKRT